MVEEISCKNCSHKKDIFVKSPSSHDTQKLANGMKCDLGYPIYSGRAGCGGKYFEPME